MMIALFSPTRCTSRLFQALKLTFLKYSFSNWASRTALHDSPSDSLRISCTDPPLPLGCTTAVVCVPALGDDAAAACLRCSACD